MKGIRVEPHEFTWSVATPEARKKLAQVRREVGERAYEASKQTLQRLLCSYINSGDLTKELGDTISPIGGGDGGEHRFKVRCGLPGQGKSGGLRLAVGVNLSTRFVRIVFVANRSDNPSIESMNDAFE